MVGGLAPPAPPLSLRPCIMDIKRAMGQLLLFFLCNFSSFFNYVRGISLTNHFSLLGIDW